MRSYEKNIMTTRITIYIVIAFMLVTTFSLLASPDDRFLGGVGYDGYGKGCYIQLFGDVRFTGTVYDGFAVSSATSTNVPLPLMRGLVLIIK